MRVIDSGFIDIPNVVIEERGRGVSICSSNYWKKLDDLAGLFACIMSHESIHLTLLEIDGNSSDYLDNVASLSTVARSLGDIMVAERYRDGMIGLDKVFEKVEEGETS